MSRRSRNEFLVLQNGFHAATFILKSNRSFVMIDKFNSRDDGREFHELIKKEIKDHFEELVNLEFKTERKLNDKFSIMKVFKDDSK